MALERQIIDTETGEVKSRGSLGENSNFVMLFRNQMSALVELKNQNQKQVLCLCSLWSIWIERMP